ncbi:MAG: protein-L-isoaspartate(D-aspartate) O-methyltransferase [Comamonadaceae bacterium]|nr:MAG: protein-L-isoaspartate(D-aspartate) O-methyltransferase [Comamonadaceae bacterium]
MENKRPGFPAKMSWPQGAATVKPAAGPAAARRDAAPLMPQGLGLDSAAVRRRMVQRLATSGISSAPVLTAMGEVERHRFVDSALVNQAYEDTSLPIGLGQTISKPSVVARMAELLLGAEGARANGMGRVLEIGTGCGYQAAVLGRLAREVYTIERLRALHEKARDNLRPWRLANVHLILGDGMAGYAKGAPYAGIISAAGGDDLPAAWCDQLAVGGRLVAPTVGAGGQQVLLVIDKTTHGLKQTVLEPVHFVPLKSGIA